MEFPAPTIVGARPNLTLSNLAIKETRFDNVKFGLYILRDGFNFITIPKYTCFFIGWAGALPLVVKHPGLGKGLVALVAGHDDFGLDVYIFKGGVALDELIVPGDEAVNDFSGQPNAGRAVLGHVAVFLAPIGVPGRLASVPHFHAVPDFHIRQGANVVKASQPARGGVERVHIEPGIVGNDADHVVLLANRVDLVHDLEEGLDHALALGDVLVVARELFGVVAGLHALGFTEEDFADNVGTAQDFFTSGRLDQLEADVVGQVVARGHGLGGNDVAGLGVDGQDVVGGHSYQFLSYLLFPLEHPQYSTLGGACQGVFQIFFNFFLGQVAELLPS